MARPPPTEDASGGPFLVGTLRVARTPGADNPLEFFIQQANRVLRLPTIIANGLWEQWGGATLSEGL